MGSLNIKDVVMQNNESIVRRRGLYIELATSEIGFLIQGIKEVIKITQQKLLNVDEQEDWSNYGMDLVEYDLLLERLTKAALMDYENIDSSKALYLPLWPEHENEHNK